MSYEADEVQKKTFKCKFCKCIFVSEEDLKSHMDTFGYNKEEHIRKWKQKHYDIERSDY